MTRNGELALFDFDGTITYSDTLLPFIRLAKGPRSFFTGMALLSPALILNLMKVISSKKTKEIVLSYFFKGIRVEEFQKMCDRFGDEQLPQMVRPQAIRTIQELRDNNVRIVVVSASPENWISKWAAFQGLEVVATQLEVKDGIITGKILGENCKGEEKTIRIKKHLNLEAFSKIYAYGDTAADKPMLALATEKFYKPFRD
jgi:phosphatidylglycerophosphatase C